MATTTTPKATPKRTRKAPAKTKTTTTPAAATTTGSIKLPTGCKLSKVLSKDQYRPVLVNAYVRPNKDGVFEFQATDSYKAVRIPVETVPGDGVTEGHLPVDVVKLMEKGETVTQTDATAFDAAGHSCPTLKLSNGTQVPRTDFGQFPDFDNVWPEPPKKTFEVGLNAEYLYALAQAMGAGSVKLTFNADNPNKPIEVAPLYASGKSGRVPPALDARGLLMPVRIDS